MYLSGIQFLTNLATMLSVASCSAQVIGLPLPVSCVAGLRIASMQPMAVRCVPSCRLLTVSVSVFGSPGQRRRGRPFSGPFRVERHGHQCPVGDVVATKALLRQLVQLARSVIDGQPVLTLLPQARG